MKCLVLILAVAVCQGAILRERSLEKLLDVPESDKPQLSQKYGLPSRQLKVSTIELPSRQMKVSTIAKPVQLVQTPWTESTKLNVLDYINRFNKRPWQKLDSFSNDVFDFKNFRDLMQFPGSEFLQEEIEKYIQNMPVDMDLPGNLKDFSSIVPMIVEKLEETVPQYTEMITDSSTLAQLITKDVIKIVLRSRMQCSTTTWDKEFIQLVQNQLVRTMHQTKYQLVENFQSWLPQVIQVEPEMIDQLVQEFTQDVEQHLYKDVMQYVYGVGFKDVAVVSHKLYHELKQLFEQTLTRDPQMLMQQLIAIVTDVVSDHVMCPRQQEFYRKTKVACWDFQNLFPERAVAHLFSRVQNLIHTIRYRQCIGEECTQYNWNFPQTFTQRNYPQSHTQMYPEIYTRWNDVCKRTIEQYIGTIVQNVPICQSQICTDPTNCFQNNQMLEPKEMEYMQILLKPTWKPMWTTAQQNRKL